MEMQERSDSIYRGWGGGGERNQGAGDMLTGLWSMSRSFPERNVWEIVGESTFPEEITAWTQGLNVYNDLSEF